VKIDLERLYRKLGYQFKKPALIKQALTHCSIGSENYERFEFLGDSILSFVIAHELFTKFPLQSEGQLSRLRAFLVKGDTLAEIAADFGLGDFLLLGQGELRSGGFRRASILADALEAVFAAVFLDGGIEFSRQLILKLYESRLNDPTLNESQKDFKTQLQEYLQSQKRDLPVYTLIKIEGDEHEQVFYVSCSVPGIEFQTKGHAGTRRKAEQLAAQLFLERLK
jgi:ribonuclease-3